MKFKNLATFFTAFVFIAKSPTCLVAQSFTKQLTDSLIVIDNKSGLMWMKQDFSVQNKRFLKNWDESFIWLRKITKTTPGSAIGIFLLLRNTEQLINLKMIEFCIVKIL
jgi:hypothetical protein